MRRSVIGTCVAVVALAGCTGPARPTAGASPTSPTHPGPFVYSSTVATRTMVAAAPAGTSPYAVAFADQQHGYVLYSTCINPVGQRTVPATCTGSLRYTADGGHTWTPNEGVYLPREYGYVHGLTAGPGDEVDIVQAGAVQHSTRRGPPFTPQLGASRPQVARVRAASGLTTQCAQPAGDSCWSYVAVEVPAPGSAAPTSPPTSPPLRGRYAMVSQAGGRQWLVTTDHVTLHTEVSTDGGRHWTVHDVPASGPSPAPNEISMSFQLLPDPDGPGAWLWQGRPGGITIWRFDGTAWSIRSTVPGHLTQQSFVALDGGVLAMGDTDEVSYLTGGGDWRRDVRVPAGLNRIDVLDDATLAATSDAHPDWLYLSVGHGTDRNWTRVVVAPS